MTPSQVRGSAAVPFKMNADRRHHIAQQRHQVTNWAEHDAALRQRGSLTVWFTDGAIAPWRAEPRTTRGGQPLLLCPGDHDGTELARRVPPGAAPNRRADQVHYPPARSRSRRVGPLHVKPASRTLPVLRPRSSSAPVHLLMDSPGLLLCGPGEWLVEKHGAGAPVLAEIVSRRGC